MVRRKHTLSLSLSGAVLALAIAMPAHADDQPDANNGTGTGAGDIVVTAQKKSERLIDVPLAISAISADTMTTQALNRLSDIYNRVPGLQYSGQRVANISLRGITTGGATSPTVALLVDDVQFGGTTGAGQPPLPDFDASALSRVEVLRGPQGTLYGASSLGGLIKYVLKQPDTNKFSGRVEAGGTAVSGGSTGYSVRGSVNIPITDWLAVMGSGFKRDDAPYLNNASTNAQVTKHTNVNTRDTWGFRGAVLIKPTDNLRVVLSALNQKQTAVNSDLSITSGGVSICKVCTTGATASTARTTFEPVYGDLTINSLDSYNNSKYQLYTSRAELDLGAVKATSITAWSRADNVLSNDVTSVFGGLFKAFYGLSTAPSVQIANSDHTHKFSQELRFNGDVGPVSWIAGGFYTVEHASTDQTLTPSGSLTGTRYRSTGPSTYREYAGFADATWHATDKLDLQVGGRWAHNKQDNNSVLSMDSQLNAAFGANGVQSQRSSDSAATWLVSPSYHITRDIMVYARAASGYRPGGPNIAAPPSAPASYSPDRVINYELGFKGKVIPDLLTIDTALFEIDWNNIQIQGTDPVTSLTFIANGGTARSRGIEFSGNLTPWHGMSIDANFAATDAVLTQDILTLQGGAGFLGRSGDRLPFSAKFTGNLSAQQSFAINPKMDGNVGVSLSYVGNRMAAYQTNSTSATRPRIDIPSYTLFDLRAGVTYAKVWNVGLFVRNLLDSRGITVAQNRNGANVPTALYVQPRTFGITASRDF
jgi:outer membrane receptor protein involved in Fe transport